MGKLEAKIAMMSETEFDFYINQNNPGLFIVRCTNDELASVTPQNHQYTKENMEAKKFNIDNYLSWKNDMVNIRRKLTVK